MLVACNPGKAQSNRRAQNESAVYFSAAAIKKGN
jgi:hypothetical protein